MRLGYNNTLTEVWWTEIGLTLVGLADALALLLDARLGEMAQLEMATQIARLPDDGAADRTGGGLLGLGSGLRFGLGAFGCVRW